MFNLNRMTIVAGATLFGLAAANSARAYDKHVEVVNASHSTITAFYASNIGTDYWYYDILGRNVLPPGYQVMVNMDDGTSYCRFDLKTTFADVSAQPA